MSKGRAVRRRPKRGDYSHLLVCSKRCNECLFSSAKLTDDATQDRILNDVMEKGIAFLCHKHTGIGRYVAGSTPSDLSVVCRGFYDDPRCQTSQIILLSRLLDNVLFIDPDGFIVEQAQHDNTASNHAQRRARPRDRGMAKNKSRKK